MKNVALPLVTGTRFKAITLGLAMAYLLVIFWIALNRFTTTDVILPLKPINTEALKKLGSFTVRVKVGMFIKNFPIFEVSKNSIQADAIVWFQFNGDAMHIDTIDRFSFDNGKILSKSPPDIKIVGSEIFVRYNVAFELKTNLQFHRFPFEDHRLPIMLSNDFVTPEEMIFYVDGSSFQVFSKTAPAGWRLKDLSVDTGIQPLTLDNQDASKTTEAPKALFIANFVKESSRRTLVIFIPLFAMVFLALFCFLMNIANTTGRVTMASSALTGLLGYRFVIEQMLPQVGYFTTTDNIYLLLLIFCFINFAAQLFLTRVFLVNTADPLTSPQLELIGGWIFVFLLLMLISATTYLILL